MVKREIETKPPVCEIECVHTETVNRVRPLADTVSGATELFGLLADQTRRPSTFASCTRLGWWSTVATVVSFTTG